MPVELTENNFDDKTSDGAWVVDFWADWCGPCQQLAPIFEEVSDEISTVNFGKLDMGEHSSVGSDCGVRSLPTLVIYRDGEEVARKSGVPSKSELEQWIRENT